MTRVARALLIVTLGMLAGCSTYHTPGQSADMRALGISPTDQISMTDIGVRTQMVRQPAASFPATIATVRIQDHGYRSHSAAGWGSGRVSVVGNREVEADTDLKALADIPMVRSVVPLNRLVLSSRIDSERDLRAAAARVHADMLFVYTLDTRFGVDTTIPALGIITLGVFPNKEARVTSTASGALIDTRTGFVYSLSEFTGQAEQLANGWTSRSAVDQSRRRAERRAFSGLVDEFIRGWEGVVEANLAPAGGLGQEAPRVELQDAPPPAP